MARSIVELVKNTGGGTGYIEAYPEAAAQTFARGALVTLNVNGQVAELASPTDRVLGVASQAASGVQNTQIKVWLATPASIFTMSVAGSTTPLQADVGVDYGMIKESGVWCVDKTEVVNTKVSIISIDPRDTTTTVNGRLLTVFMAPSRQIQF